MNTNDNSEAMELSIKSLERQTQSVLLPRSASVLELKNKIQHLFDIDSLRQRLIFQGKVLKDDKKLLDYENLGNGKIIHLVTRPTSSGNGHSRRPAPNSTLRTSQQSSGEGRRTIPTLREYTVITLDATISGLRRSRGMPSDLFGRLDPSVSLRDSPLSPPTRSLLFSRPSIFQTLSSHQPLLSPFNFLRTPVVTERVNSQRERISPSVASSLTMRLTRTLAYIREIESIVVSISNSSQEHSPQDFSRTASLHAIEEAERLISQQSNVSARASLVLDELTAIYELLARFLPTMALSIESLHLMAEYQLPRIQAVSRIADILSLVHDFLGPVLSNGLMVESQVARETSTVNNTQNMNASSSAHAEAGQKRKRDSDHEQDDCATSSSSKRHHP